MPLSSANWITAAERITLIDNVIDTEVISRTDAVAATNQPESAFFKTIGIVDDSRIYDGLTVTSGVASLNENDAYVWIGSEDADKLEINDILTFNYTLTAPGYSTEIAMSLDLKVVGFVSLDETSLAISSGDYSRRDGATILALQEERTYN